MSGHKKVDLERDTYHILHICTLTIATFQVQAVKNDEKQGENSLSCLSFTFMVKGGISMHNKECFAS